MVYKLNVKKLTRHEMISYAAPTIGVAFLLGPIGVFYGICEKYFGLSLASIAAIALISRVFDAVTDPLTGFVADHYFQRKKSYKVFIVVGGGLFLLSSYFLYSPVTYFNLWGGEGVIQSEVVSFEYILFWLLLPIFVIVDKTDV